MLPTLPVAASSGDLSVSRGAFGDTFTVEKNPAPVFSKSVT
jgi:hypothetical protein